MIVEMVRDRRETHAATGTLSLFGRRLHTIEGSQRVPAGRYRLLPFSSEGFRDVWALSGPTNGVYMWRTDAPLEHLATMVLLRPATYCEELRWDITLGKDRKRIDGQWQAVRSRDAFNDFRQLVSGALDIWLQIEEA